MYLPTKFIAIKADTTLLDRLDAETQRERESEHEPVRRSTMVRRLLREALDARAKGRQ